MGRSCARPAAGGLRCGRATARGRSGAGRDPCAAVRSGQQSLVGVARRAPRGLTRRACDGGAERTGAPSARAPRPVRQLSCTARTRLPNASLPTLHLCQTTLAQRLRRGRPVAGCARHRVDARSSPWQRHALTPARKVSPRRKKGTKDAPRCLAGAGPGGGPARGARCGSGLLAEPLADGRFGRPRWAAGVVGLPPARSSPAETSSISSDAAARASGGGPPPPFPFHCAHEVPALYPAVRTDDKAAPSPLDRFCGIVPGERREGGGGGADPGHSPNGSSSRLPLPSLQLSPGRFSSSSSPSQPLQQQQLSPLRSSTSPPSGIIGTSSPPAPYPPSRTRPPQHNGRPALRDHRDPHRSWHGQDRVCPPGHGRRLLPPQRPREPAGGLVERQALARCVRARTHARWS